MSIETLKDRRIADQVRGQIGKKVVWQWEHISRKFVVYDYPVYPPNNSLTQCFYKFAFEQCMHMWIAEPESIKQFYKEKTKKLNTTAHAQYVSEKMISERDALYMQFNYTLLKNVSMI